MKISTFNEPDSIIRLKVKPRASHQTTSLRIFNRTLASSFRTARICKGSKIVCWLPISSCREMARVLTYTYGNVTEACVVIVSANEKFMTSGKSRVKLQSTSDITRQCQKQTTPRKNVYACAQPVGNWLSHSFFIKNKVYKNIEAENGEILRIC